MKKDDTLSEFIYELGLDYSFENSLTITSMLNGTEHYYRNFFIPKRKGGVRKISSPYPTLRHMQELIFERFLSNLKCHEQCFAFVKKRNAIDHAKIHLNGSELLTLDIEDFFPSISRQMIYEALDFSGLPPKYSNYISYICSLENYLPQGACTSPVLSNAVFYPIDIILERLASSLGLKYSRYADDLAFSGSYVPRNLQLSINKILNTYGFKLNEGKTKLKVKGSKKIITGVSISTGQIKAPKAFKRALRAQIYELEKNKNNLFIMSNFDPLIYEKTLGKLNYLLQVEPECEYAKTKKKLLIDSYKEFSNLSSV